MMNYKEFFKDKKITIMGLGLLGRGLGYTKFLASCGADLIVTDLKTKKELESSIKQLSKFNHAKGRAGIKYTLGGHKLEDFKNRDMVIKAAGVPMDSIYIKEAEKNNIPVEMDVSLFAKLAPSVTIVGITGTRGKSMTTALVYEILSQNIKNKKVFLGGNVRGIATLPLLQKVSPPAGGGDILVAELDSWQLQGFGSSKMSSHISVFTSFMPDHMNYYQNDLKKYFNDKANIFKYQKKEDVLIIRKDVEKLIPKSVKSKVIVANIKDVDKYKFIVPGQYQKENLACAVEVAKQFGIPESKIRKSVADFKGLEGRLQYLKTYQGIKIYNDNNATTPEATTAGLLALGSLGGRVAKSKNIVLICGGADKKLPVDNLVKSINKYCKRVVLIPGSGTDALIKGDIEVDFDMVSDLKIAVKKALIYAKKGDTILFSPAFASFSQFANEYERNDLFMKIIKGLK